MLDIQVSVRVSSPEQAGFLKQVRDMLIARPERINFFKDLLKFAEEGGAELVHDTGENLPDRVMFLEQKFESLLFKVDNLLQSIFQLNPVAEKDITATTEAFANFQAGSGRTNRLNDDEKISMNKLFQEGMTNSQIAKISGMSSQGVGKKRTMWEKEKEIKNEKSGCAKKITKRQNVPEIEGGTATISSDVATVENARSIFIDEEAKIPLLLSEAEVQKETAILVEGQTTISPDSQIHHIKKREDPKYEVNTNDFLRRRRSKLNSFEVTKVANMLVERKFRRSFTLKQIGDVFGICADAIKKTYLPKLSKVGLLAEDREISHQEVLKSLF